MHKKYLVKGAAQENWDFYLTWIQIWFELDILSRSKDEKWRSKDSRTQLCQLARGHTQPCLLPHIGSQHTLAQRFSSKFWFYALRQCLLTHRYRKCIVKSSEGPKSAQTAQLNKKSLGGVAKKFKYFFHTSPDHPEDQPQKESKGHQPGETQLGYAKLIFEHHQSYSGEPD